MSTVAESGHPYRYGTGRRRVPSQELRDHPSLAQRLVGARMRPGIGTGDVDDKPAHTLRPVRRCHDSHGSSPRPWLARLRAATSVPSLAGPTPSTTRVAHQAADINLRGQGMSTRPELRRGRTTHRISTLARSALPGADWSDSFWVELPNGSSLDPDFWRVQLFASPRTSKKFDLMAIRDRLAQLVGLKTAAASDRAPFPVRAANADEIVVGLNDRHLDFRVSLRVTSQVSGFPSLVVTTLVRRHNVFGHVYFALVRAPHRILVPRWTRSAVVRTRPGGGADAP